MEDDAGGRSARRIVCRRRAGNTVVQTEMVERLWNGVHDAVLLGLLRVFVDGSGLDGGFGLDGGSSSWPMPVRRIT